MSLVGVLHPRPGHPEVRFRTCPRSPEKITAACREQVWAGWWYQRARRIPWTAFEYQRPRPPVRSAFRAGAAELAWTILRPRVIFGPGDGFSTFQAGLVRRFPVMPLGARRPASSRCSSATWPIMVARCLEDEQRRQDLSWPAPVYTLRQLVEYVGDLTGCRRPAVIPLPEGLAMLQAGMLEMLPGPLMSRDNVRSMKADNIAEGAAATLGCVRRRSRRSPRAISAGSGHVIAARVPRVQAPPPLRGRGSRARRSCQR